MFKLESDDTRGLVTLTLKGQLHTDDYAAFTPELDRMLTKHGKLRLLLDISELEGVEPLVPFRDLGFDMKHYNAFERIAMVGDARWHEWLTRLGHPFTGAHLRYFEHSALESAMRWLQED